ncbi:MAG TPA: UDP binding domain-containing protein, partial [Rhodanobacteraceae bacterium]|nr:UDP binding domain-containing protein [Rhodanobacteraceae bacterium]
PKDVQALERTAHAHQYPARLLEAVEQVNRAQKHKLFELVSRHFGGELRGKTVALWGLAFKPNTDDMREAPSRALMEALWQADARVRAFDPEARTEAQRIYGSRGDLELCEEPYAALQGADALAVITEWKAFRSPEFERIRSALKTPVLFDGRNLYDPEVVESAGIAYYGIGRGRSISRPST